MDKAVAVEEGLLADQSIEGCVSTGRYKRYALPDHFPLLDHISATPLLGQDKSTMGILLDPVKDSCHESRTKAIVIVEVADIFTRGGFNPQVAGDTETKLFYGMIDF